MIWTIVGALVGIMVLYVLFVTLAPGFSVPAEPLVVAPAGKREQAPPVSRKDVSFEINGTRVRAWLYLPENVSGPVPCVIMASGLGGTKDFCLEPYAMRFVDSGMAALSFDYRHFGQSDGEPRQLIWIPYQLEDYRGAVEYARSLKEIDPARIGLWGTSLSGGHVIVVAASDDKIVCATAQCPGLDGTASAKENLKRMGLGASLRMLMHGQRDIFRSWLGLPEHKVPIIGQPGSIALMTQPGVYEAFGALVPPSFTNEACARIIIRGDKYRPVTKAKSVRCPVLLQICDQDDILPLSAAEETIKELGEYADVRHYPIGHFDIYVGDYFERAVSDQVEFFRKHILSENSFNPWFKKPKSNMEKPLFFCDEANPSQK